jgi:hypothetical protein
MHAANACADFGGDCWGKKNCTKKRLTDNVKTAIILFRFPNERTTPNTEPHLDQTRTGE